VTLPPGEQPPYGPPAPQYGQPAPQYGQPAPQYGEYDPSAPGFGLPNYPGEQKPRRSRRLAIGASVTAGALVIAIAVTAGLAYVNRQQIADQFTVWGYETPSTIQGYIDRSAMTERGAFLFKASEPVVTADDSFNDTCGTHEEGSGILGCYLPSSKTILLFDVTDERLDGIEEVVAAHEMLHAAWDRMDAAEQNDLEILLETEAAALAGDAAFAERMEFYARSEPGERANELHSILGTEVAEVSPALEQHYAEFFTDRAALVELHETSNAVFEDLAARSEQLSADLTTLRERINADYDTYNSGYDDLNDDIDSFNRRADSNSFTSQTQFTAERNRLLDRGDELDDLYDAIQKRIDVYDKKRAELEELNAEAAELNTSINITPYSGGDVE